MRVLITGGGGFLASAIIERLVARGDEVRSFARCRYPRLDGLGVQQVQGDLADAEAVATAAKGCGLVLHVAARAGYWGPFQEYYRTNVTGTANVLAACRRWGIPKLVYTSTPSVVFNGQDLEGVNESVPYARHFAAAYPHTKALAEQLVLRANGPDLATTALRPHLIWGPGDNHLLPRFLARARAGRLRRVGHRPNRVDAVFIDDAAAAHLLAADRLAPGSVTAGKAYFISQGEPVPLWDLVNRLLELFDLPPVTKGISSRQAYALGAFFETAYKLFRLKGEPPMTRFLALELSRSHWFDLSAARRDLRYEPKVPLEEGLRRVKESYPLCCQASSAERPAARSFPS